MTWVKVPDDALEHPRIAALPAEVTLSYLRALATSNRFALDGLLPRTPDAESWIAADLADRTSEGSVQLRWLMEYQPSADEIIAKQKADAKRQARNRRHKAGDHSMCDPDGCWVLKGVSQRDSGRDTTRESRPSDPTLSDPTRPDGGERKGEERGDAGRATGPVVALLRRECAMCERDFLGPGYDLEGLPICSRRCQQKREAA
jgi:hypothetical protein